MAILNTMRPYVNGSNIETYIGSAVTLIGLVEGSNPSSNTFELRTSDDKNVKIQLKSPSNHPFFGLTEVIGTVVNKNTVSAEEVIQHETPSKNLMSLTCKMITVLDHADNMWKMN